MPSVIRGADNFDSSVSISFPSSLASSGYQKLPSGLIIQWGVVSVPAGNVYTTFNLPIANPTSTLVILGSNANGTSNVYTVDVTSVSNTQFNAKTTHISVAGVFYVAIGY